MKKLVFAALCCAGLAQLATGCVVEEPSTITATWSLVQGDANEPAVCPPGATKIAMYSVDQADPSVEIVEQFNCADGIGTTGNMLPGQYQTWLQLMDEGLTVMYAQSRSTDVIVYEQADSPLTFQMSIDRGQFALTWEILEGGAPSDCASVGATEVVLDYTDSNGDLYGPDRFACGDGIGSTPVIPLDTWTVSPSLIDDTQLAIVVGDAIEAELQYGNHLVQLGHLMFDVVAP